MEASKIKIAIVYYGSKSKTEKIAQSIATGAEGAEVKLFECSNVDFDYLNNSDAIIFGSPTYMGSVSAGMKQFMDESSKAWKDKLWKDKIAGAFTCSSAPSGDKLSTLMQLSIFAYQHGMIWVGLDLKAGIYASTHSENSLNSVGTWIGLAIQVNADEDITKSPKKADLDTAEYFGKRVADITKKFKG